MLKNILVVEDDEGISLYLKEALTENDYVVQTAPSGGLGLEALKRTEPDLVILDLMLPDVSGETVCADIKRNHPDLPVIILTAKDTTSDIVRGLNIGANDYVTKPFEIEELLARVRARLREQNGINNKLRVADLELDSKTMEVKRDGKFITLSPHEFKLLEYLMTSPGRVFSREMILNRIWLYSPEVETRVVDVYIGYLRKKIDASFPKKLLHSVRGFGYVIKE